MTNDKDIALSRIAELDGLRGIAILLVVSFHYINNQLLYSTNSFGRFLCKVTSFGWVGVDLFFVLSGFLIGSILIRTRESKNFFSTFYIRRLARIVPNYYLLLLIFIAIQPWPYFSDNYMLTGNKVIPLGSYFTMMHNFYMANMNNLGNGMLCVTWSIGIEEQFYLAFPLIVYLAKRSWLPFILIITVIVASVVRMQYTHWIPPYVLLPARMDSISMGVLVAYFYNKIDLEAFVSKYLYILLILIATDIAICAYLYALFGDLGVIKHTLFAIFFALCLVLAITKTPGYTTLLRNKILCWVGTISYSLYLFHYFILALFHHFIGNKEGIVINNLKDLIITILALASSFLMAWVVFKWLETPIVKWGKKFKY
jgi:peptidoglycan/LPS O-acetylase OafA/YrhL